MKDSLSKIKEAQEEARRKEARERKDMILGSLEEPIKRLVEDLEDLHVEDRVEAIGYIVEACYFNIKALRKETIANVNQLWENRALIKQQINILSRQVDTMTSIFAVKECKTCEREIPTYEGPYCESCQEEADEEVPMTIGGEDRGTGRSKDM